MTMTCFYVPFHGKINILETDKAYQNEMHFQFAEGDLYSKYTRDFLSYEGYTAQ